MLKHLFCLAFTLGLVAAATIASTQVTCDGVTTTGTATLECDSGLTHAFASLGLLQAHALSTTKVDLDHPATHHSASASADFLDQFVLTIIGGAGDGFFLPCLNANVHPGGASAFAGMGFAGVSMDITGGSADSCGPLFFNQMKPFTFGVPQVVEAGGSARTVTGVIGPYFPEAEIAFTGFLYFDLSGNPLENVHYTLIGVDVPEPSTLSLLIVGLLTCFAISSLHTVTVLSLAIRPKR